MTVPSRVRSIDVLRGAVMVLMAIDHVRVYSGVPSGGPDVAVFVTRWVTHFCAPVFVFLAGTSAFLQSHRLPTTGALSRRLVTRGLMLVALELTLIKLSWTFRLDYSTFVLAGVIWMIGWAMVAMAALVHLPLRAIGAIGLAMMAAHQVFAFVPGGWPWEFIYPSGSQTPRPVVVLYTLVPWLGVMAAGYAFGPIAADAGRRRAWSLRVGLAAIMVFVIGATLQVITGPQNSRMPIVLQLLNHPKYPPSQLYLLMTLGPMLALMPLAERASGFVGRMLETFGRVPFFYYLCHIPLIHVLALIVNQLLFGDMHNEWYRTAPYTAIAPDDRWSLWLVYVVFVVTVALLYPLCRWYDGRKRPVIITAPSAP